MSIAIVITSQDQFLLDLCRAFAPQGFPIVVIDGRNGMYGIEAIIHAVENVPYDRIILLDEDAFILDAARLTRLLTWAADDGAACIGMSDGGVVPIRRRDDRRADPLGDLPDHHHSSLRHLMNATMPRHDRRPRRRGHSRVGKRVSLVVAQGAASCAAMPRAAHVPTDSRRSRGTISSTSPRARPRIPIPAP